MSRKDEQRFPIGDKPEGLTHHPFARLRPDGAPAAPLDAKRPQSPARRAQPEEGGRLVVRREKKGRAGRTVTRVSGLGLAGEALGELARELKRALGCGASVEAPDVVLQGSQTERAAAWLRERLGRDVTVGN